MSNELTMLDTFTFSADWKVGEIAALYAIVYRHNIKQLGKEYTVAVSVSMGLERKLRDLYLQHTGIDLLNDVCSACGSAPIKYA